MKVLWKYCNNISQFLFLILYFIFPLFLCFFFFIHISFFFFSPLFFSSTHVLFSFLFFFLLLSPFFPTTSSRTFQFSQSSLSFFIFLLPFSLFSYHFVCKFLSLYPIKTHKLKGHTHHTIWFLSNEDRGGNRQGRNGSDWCLISAFTAACLPQHASVVCQSALPSPPPIFFPTAAWSLPHCQRHSIEMG